MSNTRREWYSSIDARLGVSALFDDVFISADHGLTKPDLRFFEAVGEEIGVSVDEQVVFIDDQQANIDAARTLGWHGVVGKNAMEAEPKLRELVPSLAPYISSYSGVILMAPDRRLVLQHRSNSPGVENAGMLTVFGGDSVGDETPILTAVRELREETGVSCRTSDLQFVAELGVPTSSGWKRASYFWTIVDPSDVEVAEGQGAIVCSLADAVEDPQLTRHARTALRRLEALLSADI